jgi:hypothetical protein
MKPNPLLVVLCATGVAVVMQPMSLRADAIDGEWCSDDGRHLSIQGSKIVTPSGTRMEGVYSRHSFLYVTPANEPQAGLEVSMQLLSETAVNVRVGSPTAPSRVWHRCTETTS